MAAARSSPGAVQTLRNLRHRSFRRSARVSNQVARHLAHFFQTLRIAKQFDPGDSDVFRAFHLNSGALRNKTRSYFRKIFHRWAKNGYFAEGRRLQNIVPPGRNKRASDKSTVAESIKRRQLTDAVKEKNSDVIGNAGAIRPLNDLRWSRPPHH